MSHEDNKYTAQQIEFLAKNYPLMAIRPLTEAFNREFGTDKTLTALLCALKNRNIKSGRTGRFEPGVKSWNTGRKGYSNSSSTKFKPGNIPPNRKPLYSERIDKKDGYIYIKVPEYDRNTGRHTRYIMKHVWLYEQHHGKIPEGMCVAFIDSDRLNIHIDNLMLVSRAELAFMNRNKYRESPPELKPSIFAMSKLEALTSKKARSIDAS